MAANSNPTIGKELFAHVETLFPICRSITGKGLRETLLYVARQIPLDLHELPTGMKVLDWEIPREWNPRGAWIRTLSNETIVDFAWNNLHLVQYSHAVDKIVPAEELQQHLHSLPNQPDLIPYRTAYYADTWGFCLPDRILKTMTDPTYRVFIDADLSPGTLTYGECFLPGREQGEVLFSIHCCHPSLANDNLSAIAVGIELARALAKRERRYGYRFLLIPGTIGAIAWLSQNRDAVEHVHHGLVLTCLGDAAPFTYKVSRRGDASIDQIIAHVLHHEASDNRLQPFEPYGYDERQYCSPGFDLPVGCLMRSPNGSFPEYHTSADSLSLVRPEHLARSFAVLEQIVDVIEGDATYRSTCPYGEPQLGRRGLYRSIGGGTEHPFDQMALLWVLNLADGRHSLLDIAKRARMPFTTVRIAVDVLVKAGLLVPVG